MIWKLLIVILGAVIVSIVLAIWISNAEDKYMLKEKKKIHIYYVNKIKHLDYKIYEQEDDDYPSYIVVRSCERWKKHWLDKANIVDEELRSEILSICLWHYDDAEARLQEKGWQILRGKENL